jgi:hypothetical protein
VVNSEVVPAVFETSGSDDDVQILVAKKIPCSTRSPASCNDGKRRSELGSLAGMFRAWTKATGYGGSGPRVSYQKVQNGEAARWQSRGGKDALVLWQSLAGVVPAIGKIWLGTGPSFSGASGHINMSVRFLRMRGMYWRSRRSKGKPDSPVFVDCSGGTASFD